LDTQTGENVHTFTRSGGYFSSLVFSPNGNQLAIAEVEVRKDNSGFPVRSSIVLWNVPTKTQTNLLESYPGGIYRLVFSPDGRRLVAGHGHVELYDSRAKLVWRSEVKVWDAQRGQSAWVVDGVNGGALFHGQPFAFSSESNRLAFRRNSALEVWDLQTGDSVLALRQDGRRFETFVFSPGGNQMATTSVMADGEGLPSEADLKVWNLQTERKVSALKGQPGISQSLTFSPDGSRLASASNVLLKGTDTVDHALLKVQDPHANREILTLKETDRTVMDVMFSQDGQELVAIFLAADGEESFHSELKVWEIETGREILTFKKDGCWFSCMLSKANRLLVAGFEGLPHPLALAGSTNVQSQRELKVWDAVTGQVIQILRGHKRSIVAASFGVDGTRLASSSVDGTVRIWDLITGQEILPLRGTENQHFLRFSRDGRWLAASGNGIISLWPGRQAVGLRR